LDVRLRGIDASDLHRESVFHLGAAATRCRLRALGTDTARITVDKPLPVRAGDHGVLRDPGQHRVAGLEVLDPPPPALRARAGAAARARGLPPGGITGARLRRGHYVADANL